MTVRSTDAVYVLFDQIEPQRPASVAEEVRASFDPAPLDVEPWDRGASALVRGTDPASGPALALSFDASNRP